MKQGSVWKYISDHMEFRDVCVRAIRDRLEKLDIGGPMNYLVHGFQLGNFPNTLLN